MAKRDIIEKKPRRQRPPRSIRKLKLIKPVSWLAVAAVVGGVVAAALIASR
jgi:hypothetical protein